MSVLGTTSPKKWTQGKAPLFVESDAVLRRSLTFSATAASFGAGVAAKRLTSRRLVSNSSSGLHDPHKVACISVQSRLFPLSRSKVHPISLTGSRSLSCSCVSMS